MPKGTHSHKVHSKDEIMIVNHESPASRQRIGAGLGV